MRLVGSGLGRSLGSGCSFPSSHTRLPSLRKGKERVRDELGERSGVPEGDVSLGSAMSVGEEEDASLGALVLPPGACVGVRRGSADDDMEVGSVTSRLSGGEVAVRGESTDGGSGRCGDDGGLIEGTGISETPQAFQDI